MMLYGVVYGCDISIILRKLLGHISQQVMDTSCMTTLSHGPLAFLNQDLCGAGMTKGDFFTRKLSTLHSVQYITRHVMISSQPPND